MLYILVADATFRLEVVPGLCQCSPLDNTYSPIHSILSADHICHTAIDSVVAGSDIIVEVNEAFSGESCHLILQFSDEYCIQRFFPWLGAKLAGTDQNIITCMSNERSPFDSQVQVVVQFIQVDHPQSMYLWSPRILSRHSIDNCLPGVIGPPKLDGL